MKTMNSILVPVDFSQDSRLALEAADRQAEQAGAGLILAHVKTPTDRSTTRLTIEDQAIERRACLVKCTPPDQVMLLSCEGDPKTIILHLAEQYQAQKIIMGCGGHGAQPGAIAAAVARESRCIVELACALHSEVFVHMDRIPLSAR